MDDILVSVSELQKRDYSDTKEILVGIKNYPNNIGISYTGKGPLEDNENNY